MCHLTNELAKRRRAFCRSHGSPRASRGTRQTA
jgi:hypothetical protein